jgi:hypothetical protein
VVAFAASASLLADALLSLPPEQAANKAAANNIENTFFILQLFEFIDSARLESICATDYDYNHTSAKNRLI